MAYLDDFVFYASGTECPEPYLFWSGLSLISAVTSRRTWVCHGTDYFKIPPMIYTCLVGTAGSGKSTAKDLARQIFIREFPDRKISASIQSREDIADQMASDECLHTWKDDDGQWGPKGKIYEYRPFFIISNELASLLSVDKMKMVEFLTDIYDSSVFSTGFKGQRLADPGRKQWFENPAVTMISCAVPKWFMSNLKLDLFDGGLGRRLIIVYAEKKKKDPNPSIPEGGKEAFERAVTHLHAVAQFKGEMVRDAAAMKFWNAWYIDPRREEKEDPILMQFAETEHVMVLRVATLLALSESPITHTIRLEHMERAVHLLNSLKPNIVRLTSGIGRNELAGVGSQILDFLGRMGGATSEINLKKFFHRYLQNREFQDLLQHYIDTEQLVIAADDSTTPPRRFYFTPEAYSSFLARRASSSTQRGP
jgi:hypothetical protein